MKGRVDVGAQNTKSSNISAAFPGLEGSAAPAEAGIGPGWSRTTLSFPFPGKSCRAEGLWLTAPNAGHVWLSSGHMHQEQAATGRPHKTPHFTHRYTKPRWHWGEAEGSLSVCAHFIIWGKLADSRAQSFAMSADRCEFKQASVLLLHYSFLCLLEKQWKKGSGTREKGNFWWLKQTCFFSKSLNLCSSLLQNHLSFPKAVAKLSLTLLKGGLLKIAN